LMCVVVSLRLDWKPWCVLLWVSGSTWSRDVFCHEPAAWLEAAMSVVVSLQLDWKPQCVLVWVCVLTVSCEAMCVGMSLVPVSTCHTSYLHQVRPSAVWWTVDKNHLQRSRRQLCTLPPRSVTTFFPTVPSVFVVLCTFKICVTFLTLPFIELSLVRLAHLIDWPLSSVRWCCCSGHTTHKIFLKITHNLLSGMLNVVILYRHNALLHAQTVFTVSQTGLDLSCSWVYVNFLFWQLVSF